jgi:hypothetical protein
MMMNRPHNDPLTDNLTDFSEEQRSQAMHRFALLRPHLIEGAPLRATACAAGLPIRTAMDNPVSALWACRIDTCTPCRCRTEKDAR